MELVFSLGMPCFRCWEEILLPVSLSFDLGNKEKKYRHKLEIIRDMLSVALRKTRKTKIMYQTNLSYSLMEKYLRDS